MENDFLTHVEKIIQQRSTTNPIKYLENLQKLKDLLIKKNNSSIEELNKIKQQHRMLKKQRHKGLPEIEHDKEWTNFYVACYEYFQNKTVIQYDNDEIESFHKKISEKLEKQTQRLKKIQDYSQQLKDSYENSHLRKTERREKRYREANSILKRFNYRILSEKQKNYDEKINLAAKENKNLLKSFESLKQQNAQNVSEEEFLKNSNYQSELEITKIEENLKLRENAVSQSWEAITNGNFELNNRVKSAKIQVATLKRDIRNMSTLINDSQKALEKITKSQQIVDRLYESIL